MSIFYEVLKENEALVQAALSDIIAYRERVRAGAPVSWSQCVPELTDACQGVTPMAADRICCGRTQRATNTRRRCCTTKATMQCRCVVASCTYATQHTAVQAATLIYLAAAGACARDFVGCDLARCTALHISCGCAARPSWRALCRAE